MDKEVSAIKENASTAKDTQIGQHHASSLAAEKLLLNGGTHYAYSHHHSHQHPLMSGGQTSVNKSSNSHYPYTNHPSSLNHHQQHQALLLSLEAAAQKTSSVIQQAKVVDVASKLNSLFPSPLNHHHFYPLSSAHNDFLSEHNRNQQKTRKDHHERHQHHSHSKSHSRVVSPTGSSSSKMLKPEAKFHLLSPESNRSRSHSSTMDSTSNALYVMESPVNKSSNISLDSQSSREQQQYFLSKIAAAANEHAAVAAAAAANEAGNSLLFSAAAAATDLPHLKKLKNEVATLAQYNNNSSSYHHQASPSTSESTAAVNHLLVPPHPLANADSYFNLFSGGGGGPSSIHSSSHSTQSQDSLGGHASSPGGLLSRQLGPTSGETSSLMSNGHHLNSFSNDATSAPAQPPVHTHSTRGRKRSKKGPFICPECRKEFSNQSTLTKHMITHSDERRFVCPQCSKAFKRHDHLNGHMLTHREHKPYACDMDGCDKSYCDARSLRRHKEKHREGGLLGPCGGGSVGGGSCSGNSNDGLLPLPHSQKTVVPSLSVTSDKGITNSISGQSQHLQYLHPSSAAAAATVSNASAQLQYLASIQQQKTDGGGSSPAGNSGDLKPSSEDRSRLHGSSPHFGSSSSVPPPHSNFASENALLHQLLTTNNSSVGEGGNGRVQPVFKPPSAAALQAAAVIKLNGYHPHHPQQQQHRSLSPSTNHLSQQNLHHQQQHHLGVKNGHLHKSPSPDPSMQMLADDNMEVTDEVVQAGGGSYPECTVCRKRFKTLVALGNHMRLHYLQQQQQQQQMNHHHHQHQQQTQHLPYPSPPSLDYQHQQPKGYDNLANMFTEGSSKANENFDQQLDYQLRTAVANDNTNSDHQQFKTPLQVDHHSHHHHHQQHLMEQQQSRSVHLNQYSSSQHQTSLVEQQQQHSLHHQQPLRNHHVIVTEPKQINDMIFSPITPVTPLNKGGSQFNFDFANNKIQQQIQQQQQLQLQQQQQTQVVIESKIQQQPDSSLGGSYHHQEAQQEPQQLQNDLVGDNFCFNQEKLSKEANVENSTVVIPQIEITESQDSAGDDGFESLNSSQTGPNHLNDLNNNKTGERESSPALIGNRLTVNNSQNMHHSLHHHHHNHHNFDLPSGKLTSDLYNRRLARRHHSHHHHSHHQTQDDSSRTRELSIKQIAATLESFGQSFEQRNNSLNSQNNDDNNLNDPNNSPYSYNVPTTPLILHPTSAGASYIHDSNFLFQDSAESNSYVHHGGHQSNHHLNHHQHHSLPTTPIDGQHFNFNFGPQEQADHSLQLQEQLQQVQQLQQQQSSSASDCHQSLPNTPIENNSQQQQFTFDDQQQPNEDENLLQNLNVDPNDQFDLSCLGEAAQEFGEVVNELPVSDEAYLQATYNPKDFADIGGGENGNAFGTSTLTVDPSMNIVEDQEEEDTPLSAEPNSAEMNFVEEVLQSPLLYGQRTDVFNYDHHHHQTTNVAVDSIQSKNVSNVFAPVKGDSQIEHQLAMSSQFSNNNTGKLGSMMEHLEHQQDHLMKDINSNYIIQETEGKDDQQQSKISVQSTLPPPLRVDNSTTLLESTSKPPIQSSTTSNTSSSKGVIKSIGPSTSFSNPSKVVFNNKKHHHYHHLSSLTSSSSSSSTKKTKHRPAPLYIPPHVNAFMYHSRLRSPRIWNNHQGTSGSGIGSGFNSNSTLKANNNHLSLSNCSTDPPYTPPPMLSPVRNGPGLFWKINSYSSTSSSSSSISTSINSNQQYPSHSSVLKRSNLLYNNTEDQQKTPTTAYEPDFNYDYEQTTQEEENSCSSIPQTDAQPHVNIGPSYQARIPACFPRHISNLSKSRPSKEDLLWDSKVLDGVLQPEKLSLYLKVARSMCLPGGGGDNREYALHLLHQCKGDVLQSLERLLNPRPLKDSSDVGKASNPLADYHYADNTVWSAEEVALFQESLLKNDKDFFLIAHEVKSKSVKQCIEFYYLWKKNYPDVIRRLRSLRRKRELGLLYSGLSSQQIQSNSGVGDKNSGGRKKSTNVDDQTTVENGRRSTSSTSLGKNRGTAPVYECPKCSKKFKKFKTLSRHLKANHS